MQGMELSSRYDELGGPLAIPPSLGRHKPTVELTNTLSPIHTVCSSSWSGGDTNSWYVHERSRTSTVPHYCNS